MTYFVWYTATEPVANPFKPPYRIIKGGMTVNLGLEVLNPYSEQPFEHLKEKVRASHRSRHPEPGRFRRWLIRLRKIPMPEDWLRIKEVRPA